MPLPTDTTQILRKQDGLEMHSVGDQFVIYEAASDAVHYLNPTAALVLELCDGVTTSNGIAAEVQAAYNLDASPIAEVAACLDTLAEAKLIAPSGAQPIA